MTAPAISDAELLASPIRVPGRLVLGPSSVTGSFPFGGIPIGVKRDADMRMNVEYQDVLDPLSGALLKRIRRSVERPTLRFLIEVPWNENVLAAALNSTTPAASLTYPQPPSTRINGSVVPVAVVSLLGGGTPTPLALISDDPRLQSVYFLMCVPKIVDDVTHFNPRRVCTLVVDFDPIPTVDTGDALYPYVGTKPWFQIGPWEDMVL